MFDDGVLIKLYEQKHIPADQLVCNPVLMQEFIADYTARTGQNVELPKLSIHLLNLRKRGEAKGGLPRLRRGYNGRCSMSGVTAF
jgi:hypothetical protein